MAELATLDKRSDETKTFTMLFEENLDGDTISSVSLTVPSGLTEVTAATVNSIALTIRGVTYAINTATQVTISGGTVGTVYELPWVVTTTNGDIIHRDQMINVVSDYDPVQC